ncbi:MAG: response regulator transcription factor [Bacteroidia bacterium]
MDLLLVEDDENLGYLLQTYLELKGYRVVWARDGQAGLAQARAQAFDLCILDVSMPQMDGFTLAAQLRALRTGLPFIFLTARVLKVDVLRGFHLGAEDYIKKPIDEEELLARIQAVLRRSQQAPMPDVIELGRYRFDPAGQRLTIGGSSRLLTERESALLYLLCRQRGHLVRGETLLQQLWGKSDYFNRKSMDVFLSRLRKYLAEDPRVRIVNVRGSGYVLEVNAAADE